MNCPSCGTANGDGAAFCANCGSGLTASGGAVATADSHDHGGIPPVVMEPGGDALLAMVKKELGADYRIEKELGRGGMAVVYKGVETALERIVAIKVVPPESANAGQAAERFRREARLAASLDHANIIPVYRVGQAGPLHYMAMKFVEGRAVDAIIDSQGALPLNVAIAILRYSAAGLAFAHEKKIVHRDIKGANILVDKDGRVMVSDFGIARALEEVSLTASGMVIGTPYYMSPEQCGGQKISPQSDQYSLGIMGFQMLTGEVPFNADSMVGVIQHHYMTPVPDIRAVRTDCPQELLDIIYCSLNKAPEDRFTTTREMAQALENIPQSDTDREEAEKLLRELSAGHPIPKVRTGTLPPLMLTISGPSAPVVPRPITTPRKAPTTTGQQRKRKKKKKNKMMVPAAVVFLALGGTGAGLYWKDQQAVNAKNAELNKKGQLLVFGHPDNSQVFIKTRAGADSLVGTISQAPNNRLTLDTGAYEATVKAENFLDRTFRGKVAPQGQDPVTWELTPAPIANDPAASATGANAFTQQPNRGNQGGTPVVSASKDSNRVRFLLTPMRAQIFIDDNATPAGSGRFEKWLTLGTHSIRVYAPPCPTQTSSITVNRGDPLSVPLTLAGCT